MIVRRRLMGGHVSAVVHINLPALERVGPMFVDRHLGHVGSIGTRCLGGPRGTSVRHVVLPPLKEVLDAVDYLLLVVVGDGVHVVAVGLDGVVYLVAHLVLRRPFVIGVALHPVERLGVVHKVVGQSDHLRRVGHHLVRSGEGDASLAVVGLILRERDTGVVEHALLVIIQRGIGVDGPCPGSSSGAETLIIREMCHRVIVRDIAQFIIKFILIPFILIGCHVNGRGS